MILETLIKDVAWSEKGIHCNDNEVGKKVYDFLYELILDSHLYVTKPIGFYIENSTSYSKTGTYIARNSQVGESYPELMTNLQDKVFLHSTAPVVKADMSCGKMTTDIFGEDVLCVSNYVCRVLDGNCRIVVKLATDCGYKTLKETSKQLDSKFFPMNTYFNINDFVRVIPTVGDYRNVELRYYYGMSYKTLQEMLHRYLGMLNNMNVSEEERAWASSFTL